MIHFRFLVNTINLKILGGIFALSISVTLGLLLVLPINRFASLWSFSDTNSAESFSSLYRS